MGAVILSDEEESNARKTISDAKKRLRLKDIYHLS